jgi:hypothetical protein
MNGAPVGEMLERKHARPLRIGRIVLDDDGRGQSRDGIGCKDVIGSQLVVAVRGHAEVAMRGECLNPSQGGAHRRNVAEAGPERSRRRW